MRWAIAASDSSHCRQRLSRTTKFFCARFLGLALSCSYTDGFRQYAAKDCEHPTHGRGAPTRRACLVLGRRSSDDGRLLGVAGVVLVGVDPVGFFGIVGFGVAGVYPVGLFGVRVYPVGLGVVGCARFDG